MGPLPPNPRIPPPSPEPSRDRPVFSSSNSVSSFFFPPTSNSPSDDSQQRKTSRTYTQSHLTFHPPASKESKTGMFIILFLYFGKIVLTSWMQGQCPSHS